VTPAERLAAARREIYARLGGVADDPAFHLLGWDADGEDVALHYSIDGLATFTERLRFQGLDVGAAAASNAAVRGAIELTLACAATSYIKTCLPHTIDVGAVPDAVVEMLAALLTDGLGEFAFANDLDLRGAFDLVHRPTDAAPAVTERPTGVLVPIGGGKDSAVTATVAARRDSLAMAIAINPARSMHDTAAATGLPLAQVQRTLAPQLFALNDRGALNGHVPITAIVASICCIAAAVLERRDVLLSNEQSADEPTRRLASGDVNHQYSKTSRFEQLHLAAGDALTGGAVRAWSFLRPATELVIARAFARHPQLLAAINSCNRGYSLMSERREWCGDCPKCRFVQLTLAPFVDRQTLVTTLGFDALDDPSQLAGIQALVDPDAKPFECVGTIEEAQLALDLLADDPAWSDAVAVRALGHPGAGAAERLKTVVADVDASALPEPQRTWFLEDVL
jgi:UDP-N-acetyl-alpha-D-muramoyl-L-alanyl-L-glutamate epimerase